MYEPRTTPSAAKTGGLLLAMGIAGVACAGCGGLLAALTVPSMIGFQYREKRAELRVNVEAIRAAELAWRAEHGGYRACGAGEGATERVGKALRPWAEEPGADCFAELGWAPASDVRGAYWVEVGEDAAGQPTFRVVGVSDVDGDREVARYEADAEEAAHLVGSVNAY